jgi:hypothetical protein
MVNAEIAALEAGLVRPEHLMGRSLTVIENGSTS